MLWQVVVAWWQVVVVADGNVADGDVVAGGDVLVGGSGDAGW